MDFAWMLSGISSRTTSSATIPSITNSVPGGLPRDALIPLYTADLPEVHDAISGMRRVLDEFPDRVLLGEIYLPIERLVAYYGRDLDGVHFPYNFALLTAKWDARSLAQAD